MSGITEDTLRAQKKLEMLFAASVFNYPEYAVSSCAWLQPDIMVDDGVKRFWRSILDGNRPIESAIEAKIYSDILSVDSVLWSSTALDQYATQIQRKAQLVSMDGAITNLLVARQNWDFEGVVNSIEELHSKKPCVYRKLTTAEDLHGEFVEMLNSEKVEVIKTYTPLDKALGGLERRTQTVLASRPSMGKSTFAFQVSRNVAKSGLKVMYFSLEMSGSILWAKAACGMARISWRDVLENKVGEIARADLINSSSLLMEKYKDNLIIDDRTGNTTETIWMSVSAEKPDLVVVDVMARLKDKNESEVRRLGNIIYRLGDLAKENNCAVLTLHHVNRSVEQRDEKRPGMADLRDSGEIEQGADAVVFIHSDAYYKLDLPEKIPTEFIIAKDRMGQRQVKVKMLYDTKSQWFIPVEGN